MKRACFLIIACIFILTIVSVPGAICYPSAGTDTMPSTTATIELEIIGMFTETLTVGGPTTVSRSNPYDPGDGHIKIDTEIVSMNLVGTSSNIGPITIVESPSETSSGTIRQLSPGIDYPADSFFDVFVEIKTILPPPYSTLHNDDPVRMSTTINGIPPWGATYIPPFPVPIPLKDQNGDIIGLIKHVSHKIERIYIGGFSVSLDDVSVEDFGLLAPYFGLVSTILVATVATGIYVKRRKEKQ